MADKIRQMSEKATSEKEKSTILNVEDLNKLVQEIHSKEKPIKVE